MPIQIATNINNLLQPYNIKYIDNKKYINNTTSHIFMCNNYHIFHTTFKNISRNKQCLFCKTRQTQAPLNIDILRNFAEKYNGELLSNEFTGIKNKLIWKCNNIFHNEFEATAHNIYNNKSWCPQTSCCDGKNEHICRAIIEYLFMFYDNNINDIKNNKKNTIFEINLNKNFYNINELIDITNYNEKFCYFHPKRPNFLKYNNNNNNCGLEIDCFNEKLNLGIEYNGIQHYEFDAHLHKNDINNLYQQQERDKLKNHLCTQNNFKLINIPYWETKNKSLNYIKNHIYNEIIKLGYDFNITYNNFMVDEYNILKNKIYNIYGNTNSYKLINIIENDIKNQFNYKYSKDVLNIENNKKNYFTIICKKEHNYKTNYDNLICSNGNDENRKDRGCYYCAPNAPLNNDIINDILKDNNIEILNLYTNKSGENQTFKCLKCDHVFERTWDNMKQRKNCLKCDNSDYYKTIYKFDKNTHKLLDVYSSFDEIKNNTNLNQPIHIYAIKQNCLGKTFFAYDFIWSFEKELIVKKKNIKNKQLTNNEDDKRKNKKIWCFNIVTNLFETEYLNATCAGNELSLLHSSILRAAHRKNNIFGGYKWKLIKDLTNDELEQKRLIEKND
tara:strand:- start:480 stop:2321 length:1842 start_codon:yes stop_codon:yes gene_type:complete